MGLVFGKRPLQGLVLFMGLVVGRRHLQGSVLIMGWGFEEGTYTRISADHGMGVGSRHLHKDQCWSWYGGLKKALTQGSVLIMGWRFEEGTYTRKSAAHGMGVGRRQFTKDHSCSRNWLIEPSRKLLFFKCKIIKLHFFRAFNAKRAAVAAGLPGTTLVETGMCPRGCYVILLSRDQPEVTSFGCHVISLKWHHFAATWSAWSDIILLSRDQPEETSFCYHVISLTWRHFAIM